MLQSNKLECVCAVPAPVLPEPQEKEKAMLISHLVAKFRQWIRYRETIRELSRLNDRELLDLGLSRYDIAFIAKQHSAR